VQDTEQIAAQIRTDPVLILMGITNTDADSTGLCGVPPAAPTVTITEYFNRDLNHYFLSSSDFENNVIDSGVAGAGWSRTGEHFRTIPSGACWSSRPVFRFYTHGANSHFFTVNDAECGFVRNNPGWLYEADAFGAMSPENGQCPAQTVAVWRLYNNRWMYNDSNHRFVTRTALRDEMVAAGWLSEGVTMCLPGWGYP
jgi:serine protease